MAVLRTSTKKNEASAVKKKNAKAGSLHVHIFICKHGIPLTATEKYNIHFDLVMHYRALTFRLAENQRFYPERT